MLRLLGLALIGWACLWTTTAGSAQTWDELLAQARREGKVVVIGPPDTDVRQAIPAAFKEIFGITVEYMGGRTSDQASRVRSERAAGLFTTDISIGGVQSMATIFHREKMLAPLKPALMLPDVVDKTKWKKGDLWFADPEQQYVLRLSNQVQPSFYINTGTVKADQIRSGRDLIDPTWKGKIAAEDPTLLGSGVTFAARFFTAFGDEGLKKLYVDQGPMLSRDQRQLTDWLLRGTYPIVLNADMDQVERMRAEGLPVASVYGLPGLPASTSAGFGMLGMFESAPHPAAAKVFANWIASKDGMEIWARARKESPTRNDIDEASFMSATAIPQPGVDYLDTYDWEFTVKTRNDVRQKMKDLLGK